MNEHLLMLTFRAWLIEIPVAGLNFFVLMNKVSEPRVGALRAHQIGMATRIGYLFVFAFYLLHFANEYSTVDLLYAGALWLALVLVFEWAAVSSYGARCRRFSSGGMSTAATCGHSCC